MFCCLFYKLENQTFKKYINKIRLHSTYWWLNNRTFQAACTGLHSMVFACYRYLHLFISTLNTVKSKWKSQSERLAFHICLEGYVGKPQHNSAIIIIIIISAIGSTFHLGNIWQIFFSQHSRFLFPVDFQWETEGFVFHTMLSQYLSPHKWEIYLHNVVLGTRWENFNYLRSFDCWKQHFP